MTLYWWMHWFWITSLCLQSFVTFGHTILTTLHSSPTTTTVPTTKLINLSNISTEIMDIPLIPPNNNNNNISNSNISKTPTVLRNITQYARLNDVIDNVTTATVINQNVSESSNHSGNITYLGDDLGLNISFVQSERIGIEEEALEIEENTSILSAAGITGITLGCIVIVGIICGVSFFLYHNQGFNRPQVLNDRCSNPDSSGYIDDASVRDNSEEMYSLDNDSFLNSLEAMTIQNYWTDTVKHTKL